MANEKKSPGLWGKPGDGYNKERMAAPADCVGPIPASQSRRLPAYGRELATAQAKGLNVPYLVLSLCWNYGRGLPRVVIPDDLPVGELDLRIVAGLDCLVVHHDQHVRAFDVAELTLTFGARCCPVYDMATATFTYTDEVMMVRRAAA